MAKSSLFPARSATLYQTSKMYQSATTMNSLGLQSTALSSLPKNGRRYVLAATIKMVHSLLRVFYLIPQQRQHAACVPRTQLPVTCRIEMQMISRHRTSRRRNDMGRRYTFG